MSGNPVKIRDGCATVTATNSPKCHRSESGRREGGLRPKSGYRFGCARLVPQVRDQLLRQREGWGQPVELFSPGFVGCLHSPFCRGLEVFLFSTTFKLRAGLSIVKPFSNPESFLGCGTKLKDQPMKMNCLAPALAGMFVMSVVHATIIT